MTKDQNKYPKRSWLIKSWYHDLNDQKDQNDQRNKIKYQSSLKYFSGKETK